MKILLIVLSIALTISGCRKEVFVPDETDPRLPVYSEKGNQVAGALINGVAWRTNFKVFLGTGSVNNIFEITNYPEGDSVKMQMRGRIIEGKDSLANVHLNFVINKFQIRNHSEVSKLNGMKFLLDGQKYYAVLEDYSGIYSNDKQVVKKFGNGTGEISFSYVRELSDVTLGSAPNTYHPQIIAGTFNVSFKNGAAPIEIMQGRFDFDHR